MTDQPSSADSDHFSKADSGSADDKSGTPASGKVGFVSLGCPKALVDTEAIIGELLHEGYQTVGDYAQADVVIVNTCGFIDAAVAESIETIEQALEENGRVIVTGCLGAKKEMLSERFPELLHVSGPQAVAEVTSAVRDWQPLDAAVERDQLHGERALLTPEHYAYLKISEGCNHKCSFCIIPSMRGKLVSRGIADNLAEAQRLADAGVKELLVISQDTSAYGVDIRYREEPVNGVALKSDLKTLASELGDMFDWVRLHYVYPYPNVDQLIELMNQQKLVPYLDVPLQHGDPNILKAMRRPAAAEKTLERIKSWRKECPELKLRSTFIVGFPGETEAQFDNLLDFLREAQLDRVGAFTYSDVDGARAQALPNHVPETVKEERLQRFMALQAEISEQKLSSWVGKDARVLVDTLSQTEDGPVGIARTYADAPEIDGVVHVRDATGLRSGEFAWVRIEASDAHDLYAKALGEGLRLG